MEAVLTRKGLREVALGEAMPLTGPNSPAGKAWIRKNAEAKAEMILSVEVDQLAHMTAPNAAEVWEELERVHRARGLATRLALRRTFLTMKMKPDQPMSQWIADVRSLSFRLRAIGVTVEEEDMILVMTMGLPRTYDTFTVALDSTPADQLTLDSVITRLLNEESRAEHARPADDVDEKPSIETAAYVSRAKRSDRPQSRTGAPNLSHITCFNCGKKGHYQANCPSKNSEQSHAAVVETAGTAIVEENDHGIDLDW